MNQYLNYIFYALLVIGVILIIVSIIKKAVKLLLFILAIIVVFSAYNVFVKGVSPIDEINGYKTDIQYSKDITDYSGKIKASVDKIKNNIGTNKVDTNIIKTENANLHKYQGEVKSLKHTSRLNFFHDSYVKYLDGVVASSDSALAVSNSASSVDFNALNENIKKMSSYIDELSKLKLNEKGEQQ